MESIKMTRRAAGIGLVAILAALLGGMTARAANVDWDNGAPGDNYWNSPANWAGDGLPGANDSPRFFGGPKGAAVTAAYTADLNGATINVGTGVVGFYKGSEGGFALIDSAGGGSLTCDVLHVQQGGRPAYEIRVPVTATTEIRTRYRLGSAKFYEELNTPEVDLGRGDGVYFYGDVNATSVFKLVLDDSSTNAYLMPNPEVGGSPVPTLTTPLVHLEHSSSKFEVSGIVDADAITITDGGRYFAKHASALGDSTTNVTVSNGGYLQIDVPQTSLASVAIGPFSVLAGNLNGATFGAGGRISLVEDAVLAPAAGSPVPTRADLGGDAILYQGITTSNKTLAVGDNETDAIYKGAAVGAFYGTGTMNGVSVTAVAGSGNLKVVYAGAGCPNTGNNKLYGDGTSTTADISVLNGALLRLTGSFNSDYDYVAGGEPTRIDTFNISGEAGKETALILDHYRTNGTHIKEGQTWNISHGKWNPHQYFPGRGQHGHVTLTDAIMSQPNNAYSAAADTGFTLALAGRTVVEAPTAANHGFYEELGANFTYSGLPVVGLTNGQNYAIDYDTSAGGANPVLAGLMLGSDISHTGYNAVDFSGDFKIGHEKYYYNCLYRTDGQGGGLTTSSGAKVVPGGNQPAGEKAVIGFAAFARANNINMAVDATGAIVRVGTNDPDRLMTARTGGFVNEIPDSTVYFQQSFLADEVQIHSGTARFARDLNVATMAIGTGTTLQLDSGRTATVTEMLRGGGSWTGGNGVVLGPNAVVNPGDSPGTLTGTMLTMQSGAGYQWEVTDPDGAAGTGWDQLAVSQLVLQGPWSLDVVGLDLTRQILENDQFLIATVGSFPNGFDPGVVGIHAPAGWSTTGAGVTESGGSLFLRGLRSPAPASGEDIPEPATMVLLGLAAAGLGGYVRRRRKARAAQA